MYDIVIGRNEKDRKEFGEDGTILIGKHYVTMGQNTSLSSKIYLDVITSHVVFICGKRGGGKSYTMGVIAEGLADLPEHIRRNLSFVLVDTMGIYWTMKYPNRQDEILLEQWGLKSKPLDVLIYTPEGYYKEYKDKGIPTDRSFSLHVSELDSADWCMSFDIELEEPRGILIESVINKLKETKKSYSIKDIIENVKKDKTSQTTTRNAVINSYLNAQKWGVFSDHGTPIKDLAQPGKVVVLDVSCYATLAEGWKIKSLVLGIVSKKLFVDRMVERRGEEFEDIKETVHYFSQKQKIKELKLPMVWLVVDEAHEFLPSEGTTAASAPLITILREGRQPGISLILATQQPGKIHTDVMTQSDTVISHRITAKMDVDALGRLMQSYMRTGLDKELDKLPRVKGAAIIFDDTNEKLYPMRIRPRFTWHGGSAPTALSANRDQFGF